MFFYKETAAGKRTAAVFVAKACQAKGMLAYLFI